MGRNKIKLYMEDIYNMGLEWSEVQRVVNGKGVKGYRYILTKKLTDEQKGKIVRYKNVILSTCQYKYAKEITHDTIILLDKCL